MPIIASACWGSKGMGLGGLGVNAEVIDSMAMGREATAIATIRTIRRERRKVRLDMGGWWMAR
jgi:hypothetical protein